MSAVNRTLRVAGRSLRIQQQRSSLSTLASLNSTSALRPSSTPRGATSAFSSSVRTSSFSTSTARQSSAPNMSSAEAREYDPEISDIASYVHDTPIDSELAFDTARWVFLDTIGCGLEGLRFKECTKLLGPIVEGTTVPNGAKIPGTPYQLDPVNGAFNIGAMIRWLDYNDCWLAAEWGHPSDNLGAILAVADWVTRTNKAAAAPAPTSSPLPAASSSPSVMSSRP
ncbi:hypothetical protein MCOR02_000546 [Pyricularia oryzae]|nr:hypothetical protein MCOR02_000546 [Pyricularia oryzae]